MGLLALDLLARDVVDPDLLADFAVDLAAPAAFFAADLTFAGPPLPSAYSAVGSSGRPAFLRSLSAISLISSGA